MSENETREACIQFIYCLSRGKVNDFDISLTILQEEAARNGLDDYVFNKLANAIKHNDLGAVKRVSLIKCLIPKHRVPSEIVKSVITWCVSSFNKLPHTLCVIVLQWIAGLWDYELVDRKVINIYYDIFFYNMLKKEKLEPYLARLVYVLTKPEDITRRYVLQLLTLQKNYSTSPKHITALLSLFKSYKPELVPERIQSVNIESVWKPMPEALRIPLEDARDRAEIEQSRGDIRVHFNWGAVHNMKVQKKKTFIPSIGYFHIGSSIFKDKDAKSIFDVNSIEDLGKYHQNIELPCNAVSLLANMAGYHLLTYADFQYQSRFSYNLYNMLIRAFILENGKFSEEEMNKFLTMTVEFSRYMQEGILVVQLFFDEYLYYNTGEHLPKLLDLLQWMTIISESELQNILTHVRNIFYESSLAVKCEIIKSLSKLIINLYVKHGFEEHQNTSLFLRQNPLDNLTDIVSVLTKVLEDLIVSGLNIHNYDIILLSEALAFYEEICIVQNHSNTSSWTLPPPTVIYGAFLTKNCAFLSRVCKLLLRYRQMSTHFYQIMPSSNYQEKVRIISTYAQDLHTALWCDKPFSARKLGNFLRNLAEKVVDDLRECNLDVLLNIHNHYAILVYRYTIRKMGLNIKTKEDAMDLAKHYYPALNEFISVFHE